MIKIFNFNDTDFNTNGEITLEPIFCLETKKKSLNGWYIECEIDIRYKKYIKKDALILVKTKSKLNPQIFVVGTKIIYTDRKISFTANHIMFTAEDYFLKDVRPTNLNGLNTLNYINDRADRISPFSFISNILNIDTAYFINKNELEAWSIIEERWGGYFDADNYIISFNDTLGMDRGEIIVYRKNLQGISIYEDWTDVCTRIYGTTKNGLMLPEGYIDSDVQYLKPYTRKIEFETELEESSQTEENLIIELNTKMNQYLEKHKHPNVSYEISSNIPATFEIGDTFHVKHPLADLLTTVEEYTYDIVAKRVKSIIFGNYTRDVKSKFDSIKSEIEKSKTKLLVQDKLLDEQKKLINTLNKNGIVYIDDNEIDILDSLPRSSAQNVWRFGLGGLGFSSTGIEGPFPLALTSDGKINADFIKTGTLSTERVEGLNNLVLEVKDLTGNFDTLVQNVNGLSNSVSSIGSNNFWRNTFFSEYENGILTFWNGPIKSIPNFDSLSRTSGSLQNGTVKQTVTLKNGKYTNRFKYIKKLETANASVKYNGKTFNLTNLSETVFSTEEITTGSITIEFNCDTNDGFQIYELMLNVGDTPTTFVQNFNEVITDTVNIGKGVEVISSAIKSKCRIDADGLRGINTDTSEVTFYQTTDGLYGKKLTTETIQSGDLIITTRNRHNFISGL